MLSPLVAIVLREILDFGLWGFSRRYKGKNYIYIYVLVCTAVALSKSPAGEEELLLVSSSVIRATQMRCAYYVYQVNARATPHGGDQKRVRVRIRYKYLHIINYTGTCLDNDN